LGALWRIDDGAATVLAYGTLTLRLATASRM
jgi:hypothetical protein